MQFLTSVLKGELATLTAYNVVMTHTTQNKLSWSVEFSLILLILSLDILKPAILDTNQWHL